MTKKLVMPAEMSIKEKKRLIKGEVVQAAIHGRIKVFEVKTTAQDVNYFLIFYKDSFIFGEKLQEIKEDTFIARALSQGIVFDSDHPLLSAIIPKQPVSLSSKNKLFSHLQHDYTLQETAYIAATLDSFFSKDQLIKVINDIYFHFRRNGSFLYAFRILQILTTFDPSLKVAKERFHSKEYQSYHDLYHPSQMSSIEQKDPLFAELYCFSHRKNIDFGHKLKNIYLTQARMLDYLMLWSEQPDLDTIPIVSSRALDIVSIETWMLTLETLNINPFHVLPEAKSFLKKLMEEGSYETAALLLIKFIVDLPEKYEPILKELWENLDTQFVAEHLDAFIHVIDQNIKRDNHQVSEQKLFQLVVKLLEGYDLKTVHQKLSPLQSSFSHSWVMRKLNRMMGLIEDPDKMMELGQYYVEFKQFDDAIDCFFWEMELHPEDPAPVWQLSKMYQQKGMVTEASAYQQIFSQLKNQQDIG